MLEMGLRKSLNGTEEWKGWKGTKREGFHLVE